MVSKFDVGLWIVGISTALLILGTAYNVAVFKIVEEPLVNDFCVSKGYTESVQLEGGFFRCVRSVPHPSGVGWVEDSTGNFKLDDARLSFTVHSEYDTVE